MRIRIAIPAYNEAAVLGQSINRLAAATAELQKQHEWDFQIVIVDNASTDQTGRIGRQLAEQFSFVSYIHLAKPGKGLAIRNGWQTGPADAYCFMDADLATELNALPELIAGVVAGADLVSGSRFHARSVVRRSLVRWLTAWTYRLVLRIFFRLPIADAPCGFKAISPRLLQVIVPMVEDTGWFFDSELAILAHHQGYRLAEIPIHWAEPRQGTDQSRVQAWDVGRAYLRQVLRLRRRLAGLPQPRT